MTRVLLVGHGRMGRLVEALAAAHQCAVAGVVTRARGDLAAIDADVAIDFSAAEAVPKTVAVLARRGINVVIGTTGWQAHEPEVRDVVQAAGIGVLAAANFALGLHVFRRAVATAARGMALSAEVGAWIHEAHHDRKRDAPSGTALALRAELERAGYGRPIDVASTRAGSIPGTHTVGFDGAFESLTFTHAVRDRAVFAHGALDVARWLVGRRGLFSIDDFLSGRQA